MSLYDYLVRKQKNTAKRKTRAISMKQKEAQSFVPPLFADVQETSEDDCATMNNVLEDLFGWKRLKRKWLLLQRKRMRLVARFAK